MKKTKRLHSKLNLLRKTVRRLGDRSLTHVGGAATQVCDPYSPTAVCSQAPPC